MLPVISGGPYGYEHINAAIQRRHPDSPLNWTERIIRMRKEVPEIGWGDFAVIPVGDPAVLVMRYDWRNNSVLFVHNLDGKPREVAFSVGLTGENAPQGGVLVNLLSEDHSQAGEDGRHRLVIEPYGYRWYRVGGLDYLLRRSEIDEARGGARKRRRVGRANRGPARRGQAPPSAGRAGEIAPMTSPSLPRRSISSAIVSPSRSAFDDSSTRASGGIDSSSTVVGSRPRLSATVTRSSACSRR